MNRKKVSMNNLGCLSVGLASEGVAEKDLLTQNKIKSVKVIFRESQDHKKSMSMVEFEKEKEKKWIR